MSYIPITPFRRAVDTSVLEHQQYYSADIPTHSVNKWEVLRELSAARKRFGLTDRELTVLQALLSFYPERELSSQSDALVVFPSNASICDRLNGMPCSTMRRQLSRLVQTGFVIRRDSPNGKRFARRFGDERVAYGFDLTPLLSRFEEICQVAEDVRHEEQVYQRLRRTVSLMKRDLKGLSDYGRSLKADLGLWDQCDDLWSLVSRDLRRTLSLQELERWTEKLEGLLLEVQSVLEPRETQEMSTSAVENEQHYQTSKIDTYESELHHENGQYAGVALTSDNVDDVATDDPFEPAIPLQLVLKAAPEILPYASDGIRSWRDLVCVAHDMCRMMGITPDAWQQAVKAMGASNAAITLACILQRFSHIRSPGGYLRALTSKARDGAFSPGPMVMALLNGDSRTMAGPFAR